MPWVVTKHAIDRFLGRTGAEMTERLARIALLKEAEGAAPLKERTDRGDAMWKAPCGLILITKREKKRDWIVTVVTEEESGRISEEELELLREAAANLPTLPAPKRQSGAAHWLQEREHLEAKLRALKLANAELRKDSSAADADRLRKEVRNLHAALNKLRQETKGVTESPRLRQYRHAHLMEADREAAKRCLRAALQALRGLISKEEAEDYIRGCDPSLLSDGFLGTPQPPPETREEIYERLIGKCGPLMKARQVEASTEEESAA